MLSIGFDTNDLPIFPQNWSTSFVVSWSGWMHGKSNLENELLHFRSANGYHFCLLSHESFSWKMLMSCCNYLSYTDPVGRCWFYTIHWWTKSTLVALGGHLRIRHDSGCTWLIGWIWCGCEILWNSERHFANIPQTVLDILKILFPTTFSLVSMQEIHHVEEDLLKLAKAPVVREPQMYVQLISRGTRCWVRAIVIWNAGMCPTSLLN